MSRKTYLTTKIALLGDTRKNLRIIKLDNDSIRIELIKLF